MVLKTQELCYYKCVRKIIFVVILIIAVLLIILSSSQTPKTSQSPSPTPQMQEANIKASFTIITVNITRSFSAEKYHNQSSDVYIENPDPTIVNVKKIGITWDDFFKTLPMKLTKDCLTTGDGETFCNGKNATLEFFLNDVETPDLLDKEIRNGDKALIISK